MDILITNEPKLDTPSEPISNKPMSNSWGIKRLIKSREALKILKRSLLIIFLLFITSVSIVSFVVLRHKQLCSYSQAAESGLLSNEKKLNLCPNILDKNNIGTIISNAFNSNIIQSLKVSAQTRSGLAQSEYTQCDSQTDLVCWIKQMSGELKQTDGFTTLLLAVSDRRSHDGNLWGNTDSIMLITLEQRTGKILLISFPRDIYATYDSPNGTVSSKINGIYALYNRKVFSDAVSKMIGKPIHYSIVINFDVFDELITQLGGIDIYLDKPFHDLYPCSEVPYNSGYSCNTEFGWFSFPQGQNHFNNFQAKVYARSRYASSDYSRANRQQNVVKAIIDNSLHKEMSVLERYNLYQTMFNTFSTKVETDIEIKDLAAMLSFFEKLDSNAASIVIDPKLDDGKIIYEYGISEVGWVTKFHDYTYEDLKEYVGNIWNNLTFYTEKPKILVINSSDKPIPENISRLINTPFVQVNLEIKDLNIKGIRIYDLSEGNKSASIDEILNLIPTGLIYSAEIDEITKSTFEEDIVIVIGE